MKVRNHEYKFHIDPKETGQYIKYLRKERGLTAEALAEKIIQSPKTISSWETGVRFPSENALRALVDIFDVSIHSLMLPKDNCSVSCLGYMNDFLTRYYPNCREDACDDDYEKIFLRKEYLIQKNLSGAMGATSQSEFSALRYAFAYMYADQDRKDFDRNDYKKSEVFTEDDYINFILHDFNVFFPAKISWGDKKMALFSSHNIYTRVYEDIYLEKQLSKTLNSMNIIEKSLLFMTSLYYFNESSSQKIAKLLFDSGATCIGGILNNVPDSVRKHTCEHEISLRRNPENFIEEYARSFPANTILYKHFAIMHYIARSLCEMSCIDLEHRIITCDGLDFEAYIEKIRKEDK